MSMFDSFFKPKNRGSANAAKERLQLVIAHEFSGTKNPNSELLAELQREIMKLVASYINVDPNTVQFKTHKKGSQELMEVEISLPEPAVIKPPSSLRDRI